MTRTFDPLSRPLLLGACVALTLLAATGCPPIREDVVDGEGGGNSLRTALVATDPWTGSQYSLAYIYLVDAEHTCQQIMNNYGLAWWDLSNDTQWVLANVYKGQFVDWQSTFRSQYEWNQEGQFDYSVADFFSGSFGLGGYGGSGDDDDALPPDPDGPDGSTAREQQGNLGNEAVTRADTLTIRSWSGERIRGEIESERGDWSFDATYCGDLPGDVVGFPEDGGVDLPNEP